jgi:Mg-chelatase subunit ChlD
MQFGDDGSSPELDLVFIVDTTGSMGSYIKEVQANIISIADSLVALESARINFALVGYKCLSPTRDVCCSRVSKF